MELPTAAATSASDDPQNPYDLALVGARLVGPDGDVACTTLEPATDANLMMAVAMIPDEPLEPDSDYTATIDVSSRAGDVSAEGTFHTED